MPLSDVRGWVRALERRLPGVARRDATIRRLRSKNRRLTAALSAADDRADGPAQDEPPSFARYAYAERRINAYLGERNVPGRSNQIARKLRSYSFAQSHGVRIPTVLGIWDSPGDIPWDELPEQIVIKTNTGASSRGVFPLQRIDGRWFVVTRPEPIDPASIVEQLDKLERAGRVGGPFFGQQLIGGGHGDALPTEIRVFCFYGEVGVVNVRQATSHGDNAGTRARRFLADGSPGPRHRRHDDEVELPDTFEAAVEVGRRLSLQVPRAFVRIDVLDDGDVVFGELTPRPGGPLYFGAEDDRRLGELWERAQARVLNDLIDGSDHSLRFGPGPRELEVGDRLYLPDEGWV